MFDDLEGKQSIIFYEVYDLGTIFLAKSFGVGETKKQKFDSTCSICQIKVIKAGLIHFCWLTRECEASTDRS